MPALEQGGGKKSTEVAYTLFLKTVPFIKVQPGGMVLQQCPISRGKKCTYPFTSTEYRTMKLERTFF